MSLPYDAASQFLASYEPSAWPAILGIETKATITPIVTDLSTVSSRADVILKINEDRPWILVIEFQAGPEKKKPPGRRFALYSLLAEDQLNLPVWVEVVLLRRKANSPKLNGVFRSFLPNAKCYHEFRYGVTYVWDQPVEKFLTGGVGTLPLAVLTDQSKTNLPEILLRIKRRIVSEIPEDQQKRFWTATGILLGMRHRFSDYEPLLEKIMDVSDSTFVKHYQQLGMKKGLKRGLKKGIEKGIEKGIALGVEQGRNEGKIEHARQMLLQIGTARLGSPSAAIKRKVLSITDCELLDQLTIQCVEAVDWKELLAILKRET